MRWHGQWFAIGLSAAVAFVAIEPTPAAAVVIEVPNDQPTLQAAVAAAALSGDVDNASLICDSPVFTSETVSIGADFGTDRRLVIRPAPNLTRASIVNDNPVVLIVEMLSAGYVTLENLDILRNVTNGRDLVDISECTEVVIQRCRIGSNWSATGTAGWSNVVIRYPTEVTLRNNVLFANAMGTFDRAIRVAQMDPDNSLRLYNNDVSDYKVYGIDIATCPDVLLVLLRNNVVVNHEDLFPEPTAFRTDVPFGSPIVVSSHNVAFASVPNVQTGGGQDIAGTGSSFLNFAKADAPASFVTVDWNMAFDANPDHYRLLNLGPLHDGADDYGMTVPDVFPDIEVLDDIEGDYRPGGIVLHTDRGADQLEPGTGAVPVFISAFDATPHGHAVDVTWEFWSDEAVDRYALYRWQGTSPSVVIASGDARRTRGYTDESVEPGETYHYQVVIQSAGGDNFRSQVATATVARLAASLAQNVPNPFNPRTTIEYTVSQRIDIAIEIVDASGVLVRRLEIGRRDAGTYQVEWDGRDEAGRAVASGVYFYRLAGVRGVATRKMVLLK